MVLLDVCRGSILAAATLHLLLCLVVANSEETQRVLWHAFDPKLHASLSQKDECKSLWKSTKAQSYMNDWNTTEISSDINNFHLWPGNDYGLCPNPSALSTMMTYCSIYDETLLCSCYLTSGFRTSLFSSSGWRDIARLQGGY